jgi:nitrous oxide reductase accessory protein NosL
MRAFRFVDLRPLGVMLAAALLLAACGSEPATGPVPITYGRDTCDFCRMIISDPRFAAQVRGGPGHKAYKFDDAGEALIWLGTQAWKEDANVEIWVMDMTSGKQWLDARKASYVSVKMSPMGFNYGAVMQSRPDAIPFEDFRKVIMKSPAAALCLEKQRHAAQEAPR